MWVSEREMIRTFKVKNWKVCMQFFFSSRLYTRTKHSECRLWSGNVFNSKSFILFFDFHNSQPFSFLSHFAFFLCSQDWISNSNFKLEVRCMHLASTTSEFSKKSCFAKLKMFELNMKLVGAAWNANLKDSENYSQFCGAKVNKRRKKIVKKRREKIE